MSTGRIDLAAFWGRRARRLLPALFLVVGALALYLILNAQFGPPGANGLVDLSGLRGDAISTLLYVNNWHAIFTHQSYFAQYSAPSPLQHSWSLAIEEQFYLVWPLVLLLLVRLARLAWRRTGVILTVTLGVLSSILMAVLFHPGSDPTRVYYGTDTRLFDLMAGATVAFIAASRPQPSLRVRRSLHAVAPLSGAGARRVLGGRRHAGGPAQELHVRGWLPPLRRARRPRRRRRPPDRSGPVRPGPRLASAALRRDHLVRHLPVALARDRVPQRVTDRPLRSSPRLGPHRSHAGRLHGELLPGRASDPPGPRCGAGSAGGVRRWLVS